MTIATYLSKSVEAALVTQIAHKQGYNLATLLTPDLSIKPQIHTLISKHLDDLGVSPELLASQTLLALYMLLSSAENSEHIQRELASLLWQVLGNPAEGETPPEIYAQASALTWAVICGLLSP